MNHGVEGFRGASEVAVQHADDAGHLGRQAETIRAVELGDPAADVSGRLHLLEQGHHFIARKKSGHNGPDQYATNIPAARLRRDEIRRCPGLHVCPRGPASGFCGLIHGGDERSEVPPAGLSG